MIYNLVQYIRNNLAGETIMPNIRDLTSDQVPDRIVIAKDAGGVETSWFLLESVAVQIYTRDIDAPKARALARDVYNIINNKFGLILPSITVDGILYNEIQTAQISANSLPQSIGYDANGRAEYSTNYRIILRR
jgi:hypothetical protein